jgi:DMSO/TMAO reductase YedYZ molybdopterin-dependent catalytic subunit
MLEGFLNNPIGLFTDDKFQKGDPPAPEQFPDEVIVSPDTRRAKRLPPGQSRTKKWPVLDASGPPQLNLQNWKLEIFGLVETPEAFSLAEFQALPRTKVFADFHCVTRWSRLGNLWEGVSTRALAQRMRRQTSGAFCRLARL